jgi:Xaa-Pro aminopeptidase
MPDMMRFSDDIRTRRLISLKEFLNEKRADGFITSLPHLIYYYTGSYADGYYIFSGKEEYLFTNKLYLEDVKKTCLIRDVLCPEKDFQKEVISFLKQYRGKRFIVDTSESAGTLAVIKKSGLKALITSTQDLRAVKDEVEIEAITRSYQILEEAILESLELVREGMSELELKAEIAYRIRKKGADGDSFDHIVVFGEKTSVPHAKSGTRRLKVGDLILIDAGATYRGYCSDVTRCFAFGKIEQEALINYQILKRASDGALEALEEQKYLKKAELAARSVLRKYGLEKYFVHSLGHGVGLEIHESPYINRRSKEAVEKGMVFTIEPGVYFEGNYGLRLENGIVMNEKPVKLSKLSEELIIL